MAVGRKIAINLHRMWIDNKDFDPQMDIEEFCPEEARIEADKEKRKEEKLVKALRKKRAQGVKSKNTKTRSRS
jgi:hypothetical protein